MENPLRKLYHRVFEQGQETVAQQVATELFEEQAALAQRAAKTASETIDLANELASDGDPHKQQVANLLKGSIVQGITAMQEVATGRLTASGGREALQGDPFAANSKPSEMSLPVESAMPNAQSKALPSPSTTDNRPKRGRPPKLKPQG